jgi:mRNA interferase YafQ
MRELKYTTQFQRDFKRVIKNSKHKNLETLLPAVIIQLQRDEILSYKFQDHSLIGPYQDCRECHLKPDLLLIYSKPDALSLQLIRLGSHSDLFG